MADAPLGLARANETGVSPGISRVPNATASMSDQLKRLVELREQVSRAGVLDKMRIAQEATETALSLIVIMAEKITRLEQATLTNQE